MKLLMTMPALVFALGAGLVIAVRSDPPVPPRLTKQEQSEALPLRIALGRKLFFDPALSEPAGTSCASCHDPGRAFSGNHGSSIGVPLGSRPGTFGLRNTPGLTYVSYIPTFNVDHEEDPLEPRGGQFLDGRAGTRQEQIEGPLLSELEMNNSDRAMVVAKVQARYEAEFRVAFGADIFARGVDVAFLAIGLALEDFEGSAEFHPFSSRFDRWRGGELTLSDSELRGLKLFRDRSKGNCATCHQARLDFPKVVPFFTDFGYEVLGVPRNRAIPANADPAFFDLGMGGPKRSVPLGDESFNGAFRTPDLRNVAVKQAFMHNGIFKSLEEVVAFYGSRDTNPARWYPGGQEFDDTPERYRQYINTGVPFGGNPGDPARLQPQDIVDLVAFLRALTDREYEAALPRAMTVEEVAAAASATATAPASTPPSAVPAR
jgi:cytochrome c peroxidase